MFYPSSGVELKQTVSGYLVEAKSSPAIGLISPHAGYIYSGRVEGAVYSEVDIPPTVLLLGPNHRLTLNEVYRKASIVPAGVFITPLGEVAIDERLAAAFLGRSDLVVEDTASHLLEHSLEVQLPFLQVKRPDVRIVPLLLNIGWQEEDEELYDFCRSWGELMSSAIREHNGQVLIVASSDMNHYESRQRTREKDRMALERIEALDAEELLRITGSEDISVCGRVAVATLIEAAKRLGATEARVVMHGDSGDVSGDLDGVVGYAGVVIR